MGEFLSMSPGREWTDQRSVVHQPVNVTLLIGDRTARIEYATSADAEHWCGAAVRGEQLALGCFAQSPKESTQVFYRGLRAPKS